MNISMAISLSLFRSFHGHMLCGSTRTFWHMVLVYHVRYLVLLLLGAFSAPYLVIYNPALVLAFPFAFLSLLSLQHTYFMLLPLCSGPLITTMPEGYQTFWCNILVSPKSLLCFHLSYFHFVVILLSFFTPYISWYYTWISQWVCVRFLSALFH